ncbi:MAG TPA: NUDIX domain-containing protein [Aggregatilineaceae bacterium]|nr:NUDIX domain-containing protein [Aggregatilineaceae bacterium]
MMILGVNVAIFQEGKILLTQREDFRVWCMPGGHVDDHESVAQAAIREVREEVGLEVQLTQMVGIYSRPAWKDGGYHIVVFRGEIVGGTMMPDPHEVLEIGYFDLDALPTLLIGQYQRIQDAAAGIGGSIARSESIVYPADQPNERLDLYAQRDESGLARDDYYLQHFSVTETNPTGLIEVEGHVAG